MNDLGKIVSAVESHRKFVGEQVEKARRDPAFAEELKQRLQTFSDQAGTTSTPTGIRLPKVALPLDAEPGDMARYLFGDGLPGQFPYTTAAYSSMYQPMENGDAEEPTRLFAGLGLAEDTNQRFHFLSKHQKTIRLSTAFDGPTLYGYDSDYEGLLGKVGEGGVAIDTVEDMERLFAGFDLAHPKTSVSMTINAPAPMIMAMFVAAARRRHGKEVAEKLRGTVQADILKEVQAQNEMIVPVEAALRFLGDMVEYTSQKMPRWYPISISGYHIAEAGATPVEQAAFTLSNGFAYVEMFGKRGMSIDSFAPRLSFFLDCGMDLEYLVLGRVCRRIWAIGMRDVFKADPRAQLFRLHTQTSGRSLIAAEFQNNLTRTAVELLMAYINYTNSCHSNSADEPFTTPSEEYVRLASHGQSILLEESGLFKHTMNLFGGSPGIRLLEKEVEAQVLKVFREIDELGGVLSAMEQRYQRSQIQQSAHRYERQIMSGERVIIGLNRYRSEEAAVEVPLERTPVSQQKKQVARLAAFKKKNARKAPAALERLEQVCRSGGNVFEELLQTVEVCSLGQITGCLQGVVGRFRPML